MNSEDARIIETALSIANDNREAQALALIDYLRSVRDPQRITEIRHFIDLYVRENNIFISEEWSRITNIENIKSY